MSDIVRATYSLTPAGVEAAYRKGEFPMGQPDGDLITWHRPRRRAILPLEGFHVSRSLNRLLRQRRYETTFDGAFAKVMNACADRGEEAVEDSTWITSGLIRVYSELHALGKAHSVEIWQEGELAGGLYGLHLGGAFFAESKFHRKTNMSKVALAELVFRLRERGFALLEVQYLTRHLAQFGVIEISDRDYQQRLQAALALRCEFP
jgi:leucyl/phenylalanyl-tRNA--protein transferase